MTSKAGHKNRKQKAVRNVSAFEGPNLDLSTTVVSYYKLKITYRRPFTKTNCTTIGT